MDDGDGGRGRSLFEIQTGSPISKRYLCVWTFLQKILCTAAPTLSAGRREYKIVNNDLILRTESSFRCFFNYF
jgi:hypothetical protein